MIEFKVYLLIGISVLSRFWSIERVARYDIDGGWDYASAAAKYIDAYGPHMLAKEAFTMYFI